MVLGMSTLPRGIGSWMYTETHDAALAAGARVLMVQEPIAALKRMLPSKEVHRRGLSGAQRPQEAKEIHIVSAAGSDYVLHKDGRSGMYQWVSPTNPDGGITGPPGWSPGAAGRQCRRKARCRAGRRAAEHVAARAESRRTHAGKGPDRQD